MAVCDNVAGQTKNRRQNNRNCIDALPGKRSRPGWKVLRQEPITRNQQQEGVDAVSRRDTLAQACNQGCRQQYPETEIKRNGMGPFKTEIRRKKQHPKYHKSEDAGHPSLQNGTTEKPKKIGYLSSVGALVHDVNRNGKWDVVVTISGKR